MESRNKSRPRYRKHRTKEYYWPQAYFARETTYGKIAASKFEAETGQRYPNLEEYAAEEYQYEYSMTNGVDVTPGRTQSTQAPAFRKAMQSRTDLIRSEQTFSLNQNMMWVVLAIIVVCVFIVAGISALSKPSTEGGRSIPLAPNAESGHPALVVSAPTSTPLPDTPASFSILVSPGAKLKFIRGGVTATVIGGDQSITVVENTATYIDPQGGVLSVNGINFGSMRQYEKGVLITFGAGEPITLVLYKVPATEKPVYFFVTNPAEISVAVRAHTDSTFYLAVDGEKVKPIPSIGTPIVIGKETTVTISTSNGSRTEEMYLTFPEIK